MPSSLTAKACSAFPSEAYNATTVVWVCLRITNYRGRTVFAFAVEEQQLYIIGVFYGGQDYETALAA